ncbi:MAG: hypothetical protein E3K38_04775 [Candidatus Kuenenia stuttgartiensis]|nr:hypothetical protein [Candidatus Kuenenia stuttgartiensis]
MVKTKMLISAVLTVLPLCIAAAGDVFAAPGGGRRVVVPEPVSYMLIASGGAALAGMRYWIAKRRARHMETDEHKENVY